MTELIEQVQDVSAMDQVAAALRDAYANHSDYQRHLILLRNQAERLRRELAGVEADLLTTERLELRAGQFVGEVFSHYRHLLETRPGA